MCAAPRFEAVPPAGHATGHATGAAHNAGSTATSTSSTAASSTAAQQRRARHQTVTTKTQNPQPATPAPQPRVPSRDNPLTVTQVNTHLQKHVEVLGAVWATGELTEWNLRRTNYYGKLRDPDTQATLPVALWRNPQLGGNFQAGDSVVAQLTPNYWVPGGQLTFVVQQLEHRGIGQLLQQLEKLRQQLTAEGLFAPERKKRLPFLPQRIGLITGKDSDAERDVLVNATRRWPSAQFRVLHTAVQGERTVTEVIAALQELDADSTVDVIVIARGGGDFQHLLPFSDETLLRAVAAAQTPVVSAIGHEPDNPLLDFVADLRASTPTDAAKRIVPDVAEEFAGLSSARARLYSQVLAQLNHAQQQLASYRSRPVLSRPETLLTQQQDEITRWVTRGFELAQQRLAEQHLQLAAQRGRLRALSPLATLQRGYAVPQLADGTVLTDPAQTGSGAQLQLHLAAGKMRVIAA